jgi:hypothetical protein
MIFDIVNKWKFTKIFHDAPNIELDVMKDILWKAWKLTPSKLNFMPYSVFVLDSSKKEYKQKLFEAGQAKTKVTDARNIYPNLVSSKGQNIYKATILNCDYVLVFTPRVENDPNLYQQKKHFSGEFQDAFHEEYVLTKYADTVIFEMGLFASSVRALCIEKDIDTNFIGAFEKDLKYFKDLPFIKYRPFMIMTIGKAKVYRRDAQTEFELEFDWKPDFDKIVKWV